MRYRKTRKQKQKQNHVAKKSSYFHYLFFFVKFYVIWGSTHVFNLTTIVL